MHFNNSSKGVVVVSALALASLVGAVGAVALAFVRHHRRRFSHSLVSPLSKALASTMDNTKINVLVYSGVGTGERSRAQTIRCLKAHLGSAYAVQPVSAAQLLNEPWEGTTALLVIPGGADLNYVRDLSGEGTRKIKKYVETGGKYLGICAGAYFAAREVQFEMGTAMQVQGERDLAFFPGVARGCVYPGFSYDSMSGCKAVSVNFKDFSAKMYYNGGCQFDLDEGADTKGIEVLGTYADNSKTCIVGCKVGLGTAVLIGAHPEYHPDTFSISDSYLLHRTSEAPILDYDRYEAAMLPELLLDESQRIAAIRSLLQYLDLSLEEKPVDAPPLSDVFMVIPDDKLIS